MSTEQQYSIVQHKIVKCLQRPFPNSQFLDVCTAYVQQKGEEAAIRGSRVNKNRQSFCRKDSQQETFLKIEKGQLVFACNTCELQRRSTFLCSLQKSAALLNTSSRQFCNPRTMWHDCILQLYFTASFFGSVGSGNNSSNHPNRLFTLQQNKIIIF